MASNVFHLDRPADRLRFMLTFYLKTASGLDPTDPAPVFSLPRSEAIDRLLRRMAAGQEITDELTAALTRHHGDPISGDPEALSRGWAREAARRVHGVNGLERRLRSYLDALELREDDEGEVVSLQAEPPSEPALLARRTRPRPLEDKPMPFEQERTWTAERHYFRRRLAEEVSRCGRDGAPLSVVMVRARGIQHGARSSLSLVEDSIRRGLREYDIFCHTAAGEYRLILPGADGRACALVTERLRRRVTAALADGPALHVGFGCASWPEQGGDLVEEASVALIGERQRAPLAAGRPELDPYPTTVWFEGFPQQVKVQATPTPQGIRLRMPLRFLRRGSAIRLESKGAVLVDAALGRGKAADTVPTLYVDVVPGESRRAT